MIRRVALWIISLGFAFVVPAYAQMPDKFENLQYFPRDIPRDALVQRMREFSFALNVRCQYCHEGGDGVSFVGVDFKSDGKPAKRTARFMLRMLDTLNTRVLAEAPERRNPPVRMDCVHCHRGSVVPTTLASELSAAIEAKGPQAGVERYRELRGTMASGRFDFGEWSVNELARTLIERGNVDGAVAMLEVNSEFYPKSSAIDLQLGELYRKRGETEKAIQRYRLVLEKDPKNGLARKMLDLLEKKE